MNQPIPHRVALGRRGFTAVELLIVIGILALLSSVAFVTIGKVRKSAQSTRVQMDLQAISTGVEAFKADRGGYPSPFRDNPTQGQWQPGYSVLCDCIIGPAPQAVDGQEGAGFRVGGRMYGPYLQPEKFKYAFPDNPYRMAILDANGQPILYYYTPAFQVDYTRQEGFAAASPTFERTLYNAGRNAVYLADGRPLLAVPQFRYMMGDRNANGQIDAGEKPLGNNTYILWAAGPDGKFGTADDVSNVQAPPWPK